MRLITAHKILIGSAALFFLFFASWELRRYLDGGDSWTMARSVLYFFVALGFGVYLMKLKRWYR